MIRQFQKDDKLKNGVKAKAIIVQRDEVLYRGGVSAEVTFVNDNTKIQARVLCDCRKLNIGDTVLIKYSIEDPKVVKMIDKFYMKKYKSK